MSRDYKPSAKAAPKKSASPMLTGIMIGIFIGLAIAVAVAVYIKAGPSPFVERKQQDGLRETPVAENKGEPPAATPTETTAPKPAEKPRFDFYTILPGAEEPANAKEKAATQQDSAEPQKNQYYLQLGAFQKEADADNLKAKLALMGMEAHIETATIPDKGVWHRVRVGPYSNLEELNRVRSSLSQNGMSAALIKASEPGKH